MLICDTGQVLLKLDFSRTNKAVITEMTKASYGLGSLMTNSSKSWHGQTKSMQFLTSTPCYSTGHQMHPSKCTF